MYLSFLFLMNSGRMLSLTFFNQSQSTIKPSDNYTRQLLLWFSLLPDSVHKRMATFTQKPATSTMQVRSLACFGLTLQMMLMYMGTVSQRTIDDRPSKEWLAPEWTAVHYVIRDAFAIRNNWFVEWLRQQPLWMTQAMTAHAMIAESSALLWFLCNNNNTSMRLWGWFVLGTLHLGLLIVTRLPNWQFMGMIASILWIPTCCWDQWQGRQHGKEEVGCQQKHIADDDLETISTSSSSTTRSFRRVWIYFYLSYSIYNFCGERRWIAKHDGGDIGEFFRISQYWVMYATPPKHAVVTNIVGYEYYTTDDHIHSNDNDFDRAPMFEIDIIRGLATGQWSPIDISNVELLEMVVTPRWERALDQWGRNRDTTRARILLTRLCKKHVPPSIKRLKLVWKYYTIVDVGPNNQNDGVEIDRWAPTPTRRDMVTMVQCQSS